MSITIPQLYAPNAIRAAYDMLYDYLAEKVANGIPFTSGETLQLGWMWFKIVENADGPIVTAPVLGQNPMAFEEDCSMALNLVLCQKYLVESFDDAEITWCHACQGALVIKDINNCGEIFMNRLGEQTGNDSGWFLGAMDSALEASEPDNLEWRSLWQVLCEYPAAADFFLLPTGRQVVFKEQPVVVRNYEPVAPIEGSYYCMKYQNE